jgi:hypothetical protein
MNNTFNNTINFSAQNSVHPSSDGLWLWFKLKEKSYSYYSKFNVIYEKNNMTALCPLWLYID